MYRFNAISIKSQNGFLKKMEKAMLKFIYNRTTEDSKSPKQSSKEQSCSITLCDFKLH